LTRPKKEQAVENVMHDSPKTNAIRQRMDEVRCDLDEDVQEIVEGARVMGKWRYYVRTYPWICLGTALAAGYLIVPRRPAGMQPASQTPAESADPSRSPETSPTPPRGHPCGMLLTFLGNVVMRGVSAYALQQAGKLFDTQVAKSPQDDQP
jgi:hypothetical protein